MDPRVLIVEDDNDINTIVTTHLAAAGYACTQAFSGTEAQLLLGAGTSVGTGENAADAARANDAGAEFARDGVGIPFDIVICDLMLPGLTGEELVGRIRALDPSVPVIVVSARGGTTDKIDLLKLGADDYLTKPFDLDELLARIEVQLRHRGCAPARGRTEAITFRSWTLDAGARTFCVDGEPLALTRIEFNLLETLMRRPRKVFSKAELFEAAWGEPYAADDGTVTAHMSNIRTKLRATGTDGYIKTVWGMGFKLVEAE